MAEASVEERVRKIIVEQMDVKPDQVTLDAKFIEDLGADSLDVVELVKAHPELAEINANVQHKTLWDVDARGLGSKNT